MKRDKIFTIMVAITFFIAVIIVISLIWYTMKLVEQRCELKENHWKNKYIETLLVLNKTITEEPEVSLLESILREEIVKLNDSNCLDYATYYNKTLSEKHPRLNIRWPRHVDICNNLTMCDNYHTFLIVSGYGGECILDQSNLACIDIQKTNQTKEELDKLKWW